MMSPDEKSEGLSSGNHECLNQHFWQSILQLLRYFSLEEIGGLTDQNSDFWSCSAVMAKTTHIKHHM